MNQKEAAKTKMLFEVYLDLAYASEYADERVEDLKEETKEAKKTQRKTKKSLEKIKADYTKLTGKPPMSHRKK